MDLRRRGAGAGSAGPHPLLGRELEAALARSAHMTLGDPLAAGGGAWPAGAALGHFAAFAKAMHQREPLFRCPTPDEPTQANAYSEWTLILFVEWLCLVISAKTRQPLAPATIET